MGGGTGAAGDQEDHRDQPGRRAGAAIKPLAVAVYSPPSAEILCRDATGVTIAALLGPRLGRGVRDVSTARHQATAKPQATASPPAKTDAAGAAQAAPNYPGRDALAEAAAESLDSGLGDRRGRGCAGPHLGAPHGAASATPNTELGTGNDSADRRVLLQPRAAGARVRRRRQPAQPLGWPGRGLRLAADAGRNRGRSQRQRVDRRSRLA